MRGAWIEMQMPLGRATELASLPVRGAWIEMAALLIGLTIKNASLPVRGAWIEIA